MIRFSSVYSARAPATSKEHPFHDVLEDLTHPITSMLICCCPWMAQEYPFRVRSEEEWLKSSGVIVIYRERGGGGGRREKAERGQRVRSIVFIPGPEAFWSPISPPKRSRKSLVQQPERSIIELFIDT